MKSSFVHKFINETEYAVTRSMLCFLTPTNTGAIPEHSLWRISFLVPGIRLHTLSQILQIRRFLNELLNLMFN